MKERVIRLLIFLCAWTALALQLFILIDNVPQNGLSHAGAVGRFLIFFTVLTNLLVAISVTFPLLNPQSNASRFFIDPGVLSAVTMYIFIVGLVYNIILRPLWSPTGLQKICDELLHVIVPALYVLYWIMEGFRKKLKWSLIPSWLIYPAVYLGYALLRGSMEGFYPYPFIDAGKLSSQALMINICGMMFLFVLTSAIFILINRSVINRRNKR